MSAFNASVEDFLAHRNIAVTGVRHSTDDAANLIYRKLKSSGYQVFAVNPNAEAFDGDPCYPDLASVPQKLDGVVIVNRPEITEKIVHDCADLGIKRVWVHRSPMGNSYSEAAASFCQAHDITLIQAGCPMMFCEPVDFGHRCIRWWMRFNGTLPR
jgi:predicted CoA-binding protein